jgi:predicted amidohydrolase
VQHRKIPVAAIQTAAHDRRDFERAWPRILASVERAAAQGARLIVLPEATVPGYVLGREAVSRNQLEAAAHDIAQCARRYRATIVYGSAKIVEGSTFNAAIVIGPDGSELGFSAKQFLWHFDRLWFAPGATCEPIQTPLGKLGLLVCADGRIPSIAATLVDRGAELLVMPTAWVTSGRDPGALENIQADLMVNVRARENGVAFVAANKTGTERASVAYCGKSALVDATGRTVARGSERDEEIVFGELEIGPHVRQVLAAFEPLPVAAAAQPAGRRAPVRIAFTPAANATERADLDASAREADAQAVLGPADAACDGAGREFEVAGIRIAAIAPETLRSPRGLVAARLAGIDCFACVVDGDPAWHVPFARTRAAELRAYLIVFAGAERSFAVDPDGAVVAGTFGTYRIAAFAYDAARTAATEVAPSTDVLAGARAAEAVRDRARAENARA